MLYNLFNFQSNDNWDTDGLYWYNEFYTKKPVWTGLNQFHGLQKTGPRWSCSVPKISGSVLDRLRFTVARFGGKKPNWTGLANTTGIYTWCEPDTRSQKVTCGKMIMQASSISRARHTHDLSHRKDTSDIILPQERKKHGSVASHATGYLCSEWKTYDRIFEELYHALTKR